MSIRFKFESEASDELLSGINTTPLVDVMLVLLIIFLITIPVVAQHAAVSLPLERAVIRQTQPQNVNIVIERDGALFWNQARLRDQEELLSRLRQLAALTPQPEVQIHGDGDAPYALIAGVVAACQQVGLRTLAFVTEPPARRS